MPNREITPGWASLNEILAEARMKSAMQMKCKPMAWMKLNPPVRKAIFYRRRQCNQKIDICQQAYGLPSVVNGLSHGLKIARQLSIFAPVCGLVPSCCGAR